MFTILKYLFIAYLVYKFFAYFLSSDQRQDTFAGTDDQTRVLFEDAMLRVLAAAMKADGRITKSELDVVKQVLVAQFGEDRAKELLLKLRDILKTDFNVAVAARNIGRMVNYAYRLQIADILCAIAEADGIITQSEVQTILNMCYLMGLSRYDIQRVTYRLHVNGGERGNSYGGYGQSGTQTSANDVAKAYNALGLKSDCTNEELKTAYRNLVKKYHPDRYATQSQEAQAQAAEKFKEVQDAYEKIKAARGL